MGIASPVAGQNGVATPTAELDNAIIGLPGGCVKVTPSGGDIPVCCVSGFVWMDGAPVSGAIVTITAPNGQSQVLVTDISPDEAQPYYRTALSSEPLNVQIGQTVTVTASYSSHEQTVTHMVQPGGQQVDIVLSRNNSQDYMYRDRIWGQTAEGQLLGTHGIAGGSNGSLYVVDSSNARIQQFATNGDYVRQWGTLGNLPGQFFRPSGITIDSSGDVYVADTGNHRIQKFSSTGTLLSVWGSLGSAPGQFNHPEGIAVDTAGNIYVADTLNHRVQKLRSDGVPLLQWGGLGGATSQFNEPTSIALDVTGNIFVVDSWNHRVQSFNSAGVFLDSWGTRGTRAGQLDYPQGIAIDSQGNLYVTEWFNQRVQKFTRDGTSLQIWSSFSPSNRPIRNALGITVDSQGNVLVALGSDGVQKFSANGIWIVGWGDQLDSVGQFITPRAIETDGQGQMFVLANSQIRVFNSAGSQVDQWGTSGTNQGQFLGAESIAIDSQGYVYVSDRDNHRIQKFTSSGDFVKEWGGYGTEQGKLRWPMGIAVGGNDYLYVADFENRIQKFSSDGVWIRSWGQAGSGPSDFNVPSDVAVAPDGTVYVVDALNYRIQRFSPDGVWMGMWGSKGKANTQFGGLGAMEISRSGQVFVTDSVTGSIKIFTATGEWVTNVGQPGTGMGEFANPGSIAIGENNVLHVADAMHRIQQFHPLSFTRPIATINWLSKRNVVKGFDTTLRLRGTATDSDEDGASSTFTYRWFIGNTLIGQGATLNVPVSTLPEGAQSIGLEVVDDEGEVSTRVSATIDVSPVPQTRWTFMLYLVADSYPDGAELMDAMDTGFGQGLLARLQQQQRTMPNAAVDVVVQIDAYGQGNTRRLVLEANGTFREVWRGERTMDDADTLEEFVRWAKQTRPSDYTYLAIASHGNGYQGVAWDDTSGAGSYLTMGELRQALQNASGNGATPVNVLHLDACSMGLLDVAYELRDQVRYLVVSQNLGWSFFLQDKYRAGTGPNTTPRQLAENVVRTYADYATQESSAPTSYDQFPYTISLLDLQRVSQTVNEVDKLAGELGAYAATSAANRGVLADLRRQSQKFDSPIFDYTLSTPDEYVDLVDWAERVRDTTLVQDQAMRQYAINVIEAVQGINPLVALQRNSGAIYRMPVGYGGRTTDLSGSHGVSVYYPHELSASVPTSIWYRYKNDQLFQLTADTRWNEFLRVGNTALPNPSAPLPEPGKPVLVLDDKAYTLHLPVLTR